MYSVYEFKTTRLLNWKCCAEDRLKNWEETSERRNSSRIQKWTRWGTHARMQVPHTRMPPYITPELLWAAQKRTAQIMQTWTCINYANPEQICCACAVRIYTMSAKTVKQIDSITNGLCTVVVEKNKYKKHTTNFVFNVSADGFIGHPQRSLLAPAIHNRWHFEPGTDKEHLPSLVKICVFQ